MFLFYSVDDCVFSKFQSYNNYCVISGHNAVNGLITIVVQSSDEPVFQFYPSIILLILHCGNFFILINFQPKRQFNKNPGQLYSGRMILLIMQWVMVSIMRLVDVRSFVLCLFNINYVSAYVKLLYFCFYLFHFFMLFFSSRVCICACTKEFFCFGMGL